MLEDLLVWLYPWKTDTSFFLLSGPSIAKMSRSLPCQEDFFWPNSPLRCLFFWWALHSFNAWSLSLISTCHYEIILTVLISESPKLRDTPGARRLSILSACQKSKTPTPLLLHHTALSFTYLVEGWGKHSFVFGIDEALFGKLPHLTPTPVLIFLHF